MVKQNAGVDFGGMDFLFNIQKRQVLTARKKENFKMITNLKSVLVEKRVCGLLVVVFWEVILGKCNIIAI